MLPTAVTLSCLLSAVAAGALRRQDSTTDSATCTTEYGHASIATVPSSTTTLTSTSQVVLETTSIPVTTETPDAVTVTSTEVDTFTDTVTADTITDTFSSTSTEFVTTTTTSTFTATETSTHDVTTTTTVTVASQPTGTFYDTFDTLDGYPSNSKVKRSKCKHNSEGQSGVSASTGLAYNGTHTTAYSASKSSATVSSYAAEQTLTCDGTPEDSGFYPTAVYCSAVSEVVTTTTITSTGSSVTVTADAATAVATITSTITSTSTVLPEDASTTLTSFETATITETSIATTTVTTTTTNTATATSTASAYAICSDSSNVLMSPFTDPAGHNVEIYLLSFNSGTYSLAVGDTSSPYACCNSCAALGTACGGTYYNTAGYCYLFKLNAPSGVQSNFHVTANTRASTGGTGVGAFNGEGGYVLESYNV